MNENMAAHFWSFIIRKRSSIEVARIVVSLSTIGIGIIGLFNPQAVWHFLGFIRISSRWFKTLLFLSLENINDYSIAALIFISLGLISFLWKGRLGLAILYGIIAYNQCLRMVGYYAGYLDTSDFSVGAIIVQIVFAILLLL